jgi:hypothetical protein
MFGKLEVLKMLEFHIVSGLIILMFVVMFFVSNDYSGYNLAGFVGSISSIIFWFLAAMCIPFSAGQYQPEKFVAIERTQTILRVQAQNGNWLESTMHELYIEKDENLCYVGTDAFNGFGMLIHSIRGISNNCPKAEK